MLLVGGLEPSEKYHQIGSFPQTQGVKNSLKNYFKPPFTWIKPLTFPETNIASENRPSQKGDFIVQPWIFSCSVSFRECIELEHWIFNWKHNWHLAISLCQYPLSRKKTTDLTWAHPKRKSCRNASKVTCWNDHPNSQVTRVRCVRDTTWKVMTFSPRNPKFKNKCNMRS